MPKHHDHKKGIFGFGVGVLSFGAVASAIAGSHKVIETAIQLRHLWDVAEDNMVFVRIIDRVRVDLQEVERLMKVPEVKEALSRTPAKVKWIGETIRGVREALELTQELTMRVRRDTDRGKWVGLRNRLWFRMEEFEKLQLHTLEVERCHDGLLAVLGLLSQYEMGHTKQHHRGHEKEEYGRSYETVGYGQTIRDERHEINYRVPRDDFAEDGDIIYTKDGDGPGFSAEIAIAQYASGDDEGYISEDRHQDRGKHITEVEVDRYVDGDNGRKVESHYIERRGDDRHSHHNHRDDEQYIDVKRRAEVRRHDGTVEVDGYEERDDGRTVEAHYVERRDDDHHSHRGHHHHRHGEDRYIDVNRRAEVRRRHHDHDDDHREKHIRREYRTSGSGEDGEFGANVNLSNIQDKVLGGLSRL